MTNNVDIDLVKLGGADDFLSKMTKKSKVKREAKSPIEKPKGKKVGRKRLAEADKKKSVSFVVKPNTLSKIDEVGKYLEKEVFHGLLTLTKGNVIDVLVEQFYEEKIASKDGK